MVVDASQDYQRFDSSLKKVIQHIVCGRKLDPDNKIKIIEN